MKELQIIQGKLKAPKGQYNSFGKYNYRSCEDILEAVKPLLAEQNAFLTLTDELVSVGDRYYIKATATFVNNKEQQISVSAFAREEETKKGMDASQITGTASSYARKYALNGLFLIDDTKDADALNVNKSYTEKATKNVKSSVMSSAEVERLEELFDSSKAYIAQIKTKEEFAHVKEVYKELYDKRYKPFIDAMMEKYNDIK